MILGKIVKCTKIYYLRILPCTFIFYLSVYPLYVLMVKHSNLFNHFLTIRRILKWLISRLFLHIIGAISYEPYDMIHDQTWVWFRSDCFSSRTSGVNSEQHMFIVRFKGSPGLSHFIFVINFGKSRIFSDSKI